MTTLYKRATPSQYRMLRIVEGAVKNAFDAHPTSQIDAKFARSIAKRAVGTLTAQWPEVLAAQMPSERVLSQNVKKHPSWAKTPKPVRRRGAKFLGSPSPFSQIYKIVGFKAGEARKDGDVKTTELLVDILREISKLENKLGWRK